MYLPAPGGLYYLLGRGPNVCVFVPGTDIYDVIDVQVFLRQIYYHVTDCVRSNYLTHHYYCSSIDSLNQGLSFSSLETTCCCCVHK